jgi:superfamily I DNA/RNA helicase
MRILREIAPSSEQLQVIIDPAPGYWLIRGAAGSGKTTTALLRLRFLARFWRERRSNLGLSEPVTILVLTFNRTLRGYIAELAASQVLVGPDLDLTVSTFSHWAMDLSGDRVVSDSDREAELVKLGTHLGLDRRFLLDEIDYVLGRFLPDDLDSYLAVRRDGRGQSPRMERSLRERLLDDVVKPYAEWKEMNGHIDWNDLAVNLAQNQLAAPYDVVIADEAQDFGANQIRAIINHVSSDERAHSTTFIRDTVQRIYPRAFTWREVGITIPPTHNIHLRENHRNTKQIAAFARPLVADVEAIEDGALPDFEGADREGPLPVVVRGLYSQQADYAIAWLGRLPADDDIAFLHPLGWFNGLRPKLAAAGIAFVTITQRSDWPTGPERVALSTMHSAKGLEFDHVVVLGLNAQVMRHGDEEHDAQEENDRRLLAMALGRARKSVIVGYKASEASDLIRYFDSETFEAVDL